MSDDIMYTLPESLGWSPVSIPRSIIYVLQGAHVIISFAVLVYDSYLANQKEGDCKNVVLVIRSTNESHLQIIRMLIPVINLMILNYDPEKDEVEVLSNSQGRVISTSFAMPINIDYPVITDNNYTILTTQNLATLFPPEHYPNLWSKINQSDSVCNKKNAWKFGCQVCLSLVSSGIFAVTAYAYLYDGKFGIPALNESARRRATGLYLLNSFSNSIINTIAVLLLRNYPTWQQLTFMLGNIPDNALSYCGDNIAEKDELFPVQPGQSPFEVGLDVLVSCFIGTLMFMLLLKQHNANLHYFIQELNRRNAKKTSSHDSNAPIVSLTHYFKRIEGWREAQLDICWRITLRTFALANILVLEIIISPEIQRAGLFLFCLGLNFIAFLAMEKSYFENAELGNVVNILATGVMRLVFTAAIVDTILPICAIFDLLCLIPLCLEYKEVKKLNRARKNLLEILIPEELRLNINGDSRTTAPINDMRKLEDLIPQITQHPGININSKNPGAPVALFKQQNYNCCFRLRCKKNETPEANKPLLPPHP